MIWLVTLAAVLEERTRATCRHDPLGPTARQAWLLDKLRNQLADASRPAVQLLVELPWLHRARVWIRIG